MNFKTIDTPDKLLDAAFGRARKSAALVKKQKTNFYTIKGKEITKIDVSAEFLIEKLSGIVQEFPSVNKLPPFYEDLFTFIVDINVLKKSLSSISSVSKVIKNIRREKIVFLKELPFEKDSIKKVKKTSNEYFGRVSSLVKSLKNDIDVYNTAIKKLKELPSIKTSEEVYLIAGLPNVGKSTLLSKITDSKPKIAAYPFTTKGLNVGIFFKKYSPIQVIDTPGLLDRPLGERNRIELKAISAFQHLKGTIIFVVDPSQELKEQKNLLIELKKLFSDKGFIIVINKTDLINKEKMDLVLKEFSGQYVVIEGNELNNLKEELLK
ncbi:MAG: 50S ribosome-binding GTPase [Candidatus ainarchaeum sp.]|nr:50S ribosome-binding GTPase [Candidatus ainarchaeum sp.]